MADVFISYAREDREFAQRLANVLKANSFSVWWDLDLIGGDNYRAKIYTIIGEVSRVLVLWSKDSIRSAWVIDEASEAKGLGKLIPLSIDGSRPPLGFGDLHTISCTDFNSALHQLVASITAGSGHMAA
jgi:hypothetical protein